MTVAPPVTRTRRVASARPDQTVTAADEIPRPHLLVRTELFPPGLAATKHQSPGGSWNSRMIMINRMNVSCDYLLKYDHTNDRQELDK